MTCDTGRKAQFEKFEQQFVFPKLANTEVTNSLA